MVLTLPSRARRSRGGFTLVEWMIVVAIVAVIAVIAAVAIPSLLNSRKSANEARALADLRGIVAEFDVDHAALSTGSLSRVGRHGDDVHPRRVMAGMGCG